MTEEKVDYEVSTDQCRCKECKELPDCDCFLPIDISGICLCDVCAIELPDDCLVCPHYELEYGLLPDVGLDEVIFEPLHDDFTLPEYASEGDSGLDVKSLEEYDLQPGETHLFKLGFKMQIPKHHLHDYGFRWEVQARPRSGLSLKTGLRVANAPGTIDNFYTSEVGIILTNTGAYSMIIAKGDRIAQLVFSEIVRPLKMTIGKVQDKRTGGFGSTGK